MGDRVIYAVLLACLLLAIVVAVAYVVKAFIEVIEWKRGGKDGHGGKD